MKKITLILCLCVAISAYAQNIVRCGTVTDYDGNVYQTVKIGTQCWMAENLRTTHYADGTEIFMDGNRVSNIIPYRYYPGKSEKNVPTYGFFYNWAAVMGGSTSSASVPSNVQGVCPNGWHVPSFEEYMTLLDYVALQPQYQCDGSISKAVKALASTTGWEECVVKNSPGCNSQENNATGFSMLPAGGYISPLFESEACLGSIAVFWSTTEKSDIRAYRLFIDYGFMALNRKTSHMEKIDGFSVRCLRGWGMLDVEKLAEQLKTAPQGVDVGNRNARIVEDLQSALPFIKPFINKPADYSNPFLYPYLYPELVGAPSTSTSSDASSNSSTSSSTPTTSSQRVCPRCHGTGREDRDDGVCFGLDSKYCDECKKNVSCSHYHITCTLCHGKGYY